MDIIDNIFSRLDPPKFLYCYTTSDGLFDIINTRILRAESIQYPPTADKVFYALSMVFMEIKKTLKKLEQNPDNLDKTLSLRQTRFLKDILDRLDSHENFQLFSCSFFQDGDIPIKWKGYGAIENCFSLGIESKAMIDLAGKQGFNLARSIYDESDQLKIINDLIDESLIKISRANHSQSEWLLALDNISDEFTMKFLKLSVIFKNPSFESEEWNLYSMPYPMISTNKAMSFHVVNGMIVPCLNFELDKGHGETDSVSKIIIGPSSRPGLVKNSVGLLLASRGINRCEIEFSRIPYRG